MRLDDGNPQVASPAEEEARVGQFVLTLGRPSSQDVQASLGIVSNIGGGFALSLKGAKRRGAVDTLGSGVELGLTGPRGHLTLRSGIFVPMRFPSLVSQVVD